MGWVVGPLIVAGLLPLLLALHANRGASLSHALVWAMVAWLSWGIALLLGEPERVGMDAGRYCALCLTGCAGVAVLGARRPHVAAWNFVVIGLFAVMVLPLVESLFIGTRSVDGVRIFFMSATIAVGILNYLPTRLAPAAVTLLAACAGEIALLFAPLPGQGEAWALHGLLLATPWIGWLCVRRHCGDRAAFDHIWLAFRDRWGLFWSQRVREQFNQAMQHAGWPVALRWRGLVIQRGAAPPSAADQEKIVETMRAVLQRFIPPPN